MKARALPALSLGLLLCPAAQSLEAAPPYAPLAFLAGSCWKGTFPKSTVTDEHCFSWIYGGRFLRDRHVVHREGKPDDRGESVYVWDAVRHELRYLYIESAGGFAEGTVTAEDGVLVFPATRYTEGGEDQTYRSRWRRQGPDAYEVVTEFKAGEAWQPGLTVRMVRSREAPGD
ncbi:MAG: hypothetical protein JSS29_10700 [Proteobacteria bacterium]|nr:hypothetical protein [Pseudomonadota bacterium]